MEKVFVTVEQTKNNFGAYIDELPGCVITGDTKETIEENTKEAIESHLNALKDFGAVPTAKFLGEYELVFQYK